MSDSATTKTSSDGWVVLLVKPKDGTEINIRLSQPRALELIRDLSSAIEEAMTP